jgi:hypothetical protein
MEPREWRIMEVLERSGAPVTVSSSGRAGDDAARFVPDSPLEGSGFELSVPLARATASNLSFPSGSAAIDGLSGSEGKPLGGGAAER